MDNFKFGIFDVFSATIPGIPLTILFSFSINKEVFSIEIISESISKLNLGSAIFLLIISYVLGFATQYLSYEIFKFIVTKFKVCHNRIGTFEVSLGKRGGELSKLREFSKENYIILNVFMALRAMSYNLFFTLMIFCIGTILLTWFIGEFDYEIWFILIFSFLFSILFFRRAISFHEWSHKLIDDSKSTIDDVLSQKSIIKIELDENI